MKFLTAPFRFVFSAIAALFRVSWLITSWLFTALLGSWNMPSWLTYAGAKAVQYFRFLRQRRLLAALHIIIPPLLLGGGYAGYLWYQSLPQPVTTAFTVKAPAATSWSEGQPSINPLYVNFSDSVAPLDHPEGALSQVPQLKPETAGEWFWENEFKLRFVPASDWKIDTRYTVTMGPEVQLASHITLRNKDASFSTSPFRVSKGNVQFYQDPLDATQKKVIASVSFSHPVDPVTFERNISISPESGLEFVNAGEKPFTVIYGDSNLSAFIHSAAIAVPRLDRKLEVEVDSGVKPKADGNASDNTLHWTQDIPGRGRLKIENPDIEIVETDSNPEQVLMIRTNAPVSEKAFADHVQLWLLPERDPRHPEYGRQYWNNSNVTADVINAAERIHPAYLPGEFENSQLHNLKLDVPQNRFLLIKAEPGLTAVGGYELANRYSDVIQVPEYPKMLKFMSDGNLLSLKGEKKVAVLSRGQQRFSYEVERILPEQLHHFIADNGADPAAPDLSEGQMNKIVERFSGRIDININDPKKLNSSAIDLGQYLNTSGTSRGLFLISLSASDQAPDYSFGEFPETRRLIALTDMGLIVKRGKDGNQDLFVVSLSSGKPVAGASARLVSYNGLPLQTLITDDNGHAQFSAQGYRQRERQPLAYIVTKDGDSAFISYSGGNRDINYSRFDIGGENDTDANELSAYAFSDRDLYRPGETAHLMYIVRSGNWKPVYDGMPVQMEVYDPRGMLVLNERRQLHNTGFDAVDLKLAEGALTGDYRFRVSRVYDVKYGHASELGSVTFNVREFEPDRLKVRASLSEQPVRGWLKPQAVAGRVNVQHLFGTPAVGARVTGSMQIRQAYPQFSQYADYRFFDRSNGTSQLSGQEEYLGEQLTDDQGNADFSLDLSRFARATYTLDFNTNSFEKGSGRGVSANTSQLVSDADFMIGYKADGKLNIKHHSERNVQFIAVSPSLDLVKPENLRLETVETRYVSVLARQYNGTYRYVSRKREFILSTEDVSFTERGLELRLNSNNPGEFSLRLRNADNQTLASLNYEVAGTANLSRSLERNAELQVSLNQAEYKNGDTIEVSIIAPYTGTGLITIERDKVYASKWFKTSTTSSVQTITLPAGIEGNAYINVQFIRGAESEEIYMSPLSVGVVPFNINRSARVISASLSVPQRVRPGEALQMTLNSPESARAVLVAVDEGILQVAKFKTPDPLAHFLRKRRLQVNTRQMVDLILPEFSQILASAPGGDSAAALAQNLNPFKKKRNPPVVWWSELQDVHSGDNRFEFTAPDYFNGRVRLYAVLVNQDRMQVVAQNTFIQGDIILSPTVPAAISPNDEVNLALSVYNNIKDSGTASIEVEAVLPPGAEIIGENKRTVSIAEGRDQLVEFRLRAGSAPGEKTIQFRASADAAGVHYQAKYRESVSVRPASPYRTVLQAGVLDQNASTDLSQLRLMHKEFASSTVDAGVSPLLWASGLAAYLNDYAHLCTEQLTSRAVPDLVLSRYPDIAGQGGAMQLPQALRLLRGRQNDEGGFGMWDATPNASPYYTLFALNFMLEAKERNQAVADDMLNQALTYTEHFIQRPQSNLDELRMAAYGVYLIARSGRTPGLLLTTVQADLEKYFPQTWQQDIAAAYLAAALKLQQQHDKANPLMQKLQWTNYGRRDRVLIFQDALTENAIHLYLLAKHFPDLLPTLPRSVLMNMASAISAQQFHSHSAAWLIMALDTYHQRASSNAAAVDIRYLTSGAKQPQPLSLTNNSFGQHGDIPLNASSLTLTNPNELPLFYSVRQTGYDQQAEQASNKGVEIVRDFTDLNGNAKTRFTVGDEFLVRLRLRALKDGRYEQLAIVDLLPGGIEPVPVINPASTSDSDENEDGGTHTSKVLTSVKGPWSLDYDNLRDDRLMLYGSLNGSSLTELTYKVRAVSSGKFTVPVAFVQAMYEPELFSITAPGTLEIDKPDSAKSGGQ